MIVPGLGGFVTNYQSAKVHPTSFIFNSPSKSVAFNVNLIDSDGLLINTLVREDNLSARDAELGIAEFVSQIKSALNENKPVKLAGIGRLTQDIEKNIQFLPDNSQNFLSQSYGLYSFTAAPVNRVQPSFEVKPLKAVTSTKSRKKRTLSDSLLPIAAVLLLTMLTMQIFIQTSMNGFDYAEIFGMKKIFTRNNYLLEKYEPIKFDVNQSILYYRKAVADPEVVLSESPAENIEAPLETKMEYTGSSQSKYVIVAGSYYTAAQVEVALNKLKLKGYDGFIKPWGKYQLASVPIPDNISPSSFREIFIEATGIKGAWVTKN